MNTQKLESLKRRGSLAYGKYFSAMKIMVEDNSEMLVRAIEECKSLAKEIDELLTMVFGDFHHAYIHPHTIGNEMKGKFCLLKTPNIETREFYMAYNDTLIYSYGRLSASQEELARTLCGFLNYRPIQALYYYFHPNNDIIELLLNQ
jgi:cyclopropane fatty-acyl-phospholipid synthase-like methyltransferase